jgi:LacI family transcriptional regulator
MWQGDGVIGRFSAQDQLDQIRERGIPAVNVETIYADVPNVWDVSTDEAARARVALEHLRDRGFEQFAIFAPPSHRYSARLGEEFAAAVKAAGFECHEYRKPALRAAARRIDWAERQRRVTQWLSQLPRPIAVLAVDSLRGRQLAEICALSHIRVPDQVAILAGDTDDLLCEVCTPPLSSIAVPARRIGYEAAAALDRLMNGESVGTPVRIPPEGVITRPSTEVLAIADDTVVRALRFIHARAFQDIVVKDILAEVPVSRRSLEIQFRRFLGRSPAEEIRRVRLDKGRELLGRSDLSISEIATACGFANGTRFGASFRKRFGKTPLAYRKQLIRGA